MRIGIVGDTHGRIEKVKKAWAKQAFDFFIHTGDFYSDARRLAHHLKCEFYGVAGNCDARGSACEELILEIEGRKFYVVHGHQYGIKQGYNRIFYRGQELQADIVICGHTHIPCCEKVDNLWLLNPGSPSRPRHEKMKSYICLEIDQHTIHPQLCTISL